VFSKLLNNNELIFIPWPGRGRVLSTPISTGFVFVVSQIVSSPDFFPLATLGPFGYPSEADSGSYTQNIAITSYKQTVTLANSRLLRPTSSADSHILGCPKRSPLISPPSDPGTLNARRVCPCEIATVEVFKVHFSTSVLDNSFYTKKILSVSDTITKLAVSLHLPYFSMPSNTTHLVPSGKPAHSVLGFNALSSENQ
jgi:hypothetical protein